MERIAPCAQLSRPDKWSLGGGDRLVWAPPHPQWLDTLGFWDEAHYYDCSLSPGFAVTVLRADGRPVTLHSGERHWRPDRLRQAYKAPDAPLTLRETKTAHANDTLASTLRLKNTGASPLTLAVVVWTVHPVAPSDAADGIERLQAAGDQLHFVRRVSAGDDRSYEVGCALGLDRSPTSPAAVVSESGPDQPHWQYTPFYETLSETALGPAPATADLTAPGRVYLGLHTEIEISAGDAEQLSAALGAAPAVDAAGTQAADTLATAPPARSERTWQRYFDALPTFECSDPHLQRYYWYRWYGLRLFTRHSPEGNYRHPAVYEGPEYFRKHVSYSAQCHMLETRWRSDPSVARGSLLNFLSNQDPDGALPGHLYPYGADEESFYHTNWGHAWAVHRTHPDEAFLRTAYDGLSDYVDYFDAARDPEDSGLYDIWNHYETGQEYMRRYQTVSDRADKIHWGRIFRLKGVDAAVQLYQTKRTLARMAEALDRPDEAAEWAARAATTKQAVLDHMWDPEAELFFDVDPETSTRTGVKAAVCFYPYFTDIVDERHRPALERHLFDPDAFWTPYPVPATSRDDPSFEAVPHWKGRRKNCPWNGRLWPMTNSHVAEAICQAALRYEDDGLRRRGAAFITRFIRTMFDGGDPKRPNCFEHYNPLTGQGSRYRGINDYQHSWVVDLLVKYAAGIRPDDATVTVDPFPFDVEHLALRDVPVRGRRVSVARTHDRFEVRVDGERAAERAVGEPVRLSF
ncbi:MAG: trehalase family glycosidase [Salinibacter sp.]